MCGSRKYPHPHHGGNWKFWRGGGVKDPGNSEGEGGCMIGFLSRGPLIQYGFECRSSCSKILSYLLSRTFTWKIEAWILVFDFIIFEIHFLFSKSTLEANKCEEHALAWKWKWPPLLVISLQGVTLWTKKHWRLAFFVFGSRFLSWKLVSL